MEDTSLDQYIPPLLKTQEELAFDDNNLGLMTNTKYDKLVRKMETNTLSKVETDIYLRVDTIADKFPSRKQLIAKRKKHGKNEYTQAPVMCPKNVYQNIYELWKQYKAMHGMACNRRKFKNFINNNSFSLHVDEFLERTGLYPAGGQLNNAMFESLPHFVASFLLACSSANQLPSLPNQPTAGAPPIIPPGAHYHFHHYQFQDGSNYYAPGSNATVINSATLHPGALGCLPSNILSALPSLAPATTTTTAAAAVEPAVLPNTGIVPPNAGATGTATAADATGTAAHQDDGVFDGKFAAASLDNNNAIFIDDDDDDDNYNDDDDDDDDDVANTSTTIMAVAGLPHCNNGAATAAAVEPVIQPNTGIVVPPNAGATATATSTAAAAATQPTTVSLAPTGSVATGTAAHQDDGVLDGKFAAASLDEENLKNASAASTKPVRSVSFRKKLTAAYHIESPPANFYRTPENDKMLSDDVSTTQMNEIPFRMDQWHVNSFKEFTLLCDQWCKTFTVLDPAEANLLCVRFLAYAVVEHEHFFDLLFSNPQDDITSTVLEYFVQRNWLKEKSGCALKSCIKDDYIPSFRQGCTVWYRKLDENGNLSGLVPATINSVHQGILGSYTITFEEVDPSTGDSRIVTKETTIHRIQFGSVA